MESYVVTVPDLPAELLIDERLPEAVTAWLTGQSYAVGAVSVRLNPPALVIEADGDPSAVLAKWTPGPSPEKVARTELTGALAEIRAKPAVTRTPAERAALAMAALLRLAG